jgi:hypothetical protein
MITNQFKLVTREGVFAQTVGRQPLNLDVGAPLTKLNIRVQYTVTNTASAPTGQPWGALGQLAQLIQRLELVVNGQDTVVSVQPWLYLFRLIYERRGVLPRGMENPINMSASQVTNVDFVIPLHFDLLRGRKRNDCAIDLRGIRACQLYATFGTVNNVFTVPNSATITNVAVTVEAQYIEQVPAKDKKGNPILFAVRQLDEINYPILGANNQFTQDVDQRTGVNLITLATFFSTVSSSTPAGDDTGLINGLTFTGDIKVKSGGTYFYSSQAPHIKADVRDEFMIGPTFQSENAIEIPGMYMLDLRYDGKLSTGIPTGNLDANLQMLINENYTSGNTTLFIQRESVRPLNVGP